MTVYKVADYVKLGCAEDNLSDRDPSRVRDRQREEKGRATVFKRGNDQ